MSPTDSDQAALLAQYTAACDYPGALDAEAVSRHLSRYLAALGVARAVVRLPRGWALEDHPPLARSVDAVLADCARRDPSQPARAARDALDARVARVALAARVTHDALDALGARAKHHFVAWCVQAGGVVELLV